MEGKGRFLSVACVLAVSLFLTNSLTAPANIHKRTANTIPNIPDPGYLNIWSLAENYDVNRRMLASLYREHRDIWIASNDRHKALLDRFNTPCMLLSTGRYLMDEATAGDDLALVRSVTHEDGEILMQEWIKADPEGYRTLMKEVLSDTVIMKLYSALEEGVMSSEDPQLVFNHLMAKAFELRIITEKHVASKNELSAEELDFLEVMIPVTESRESDGSKYFPDFFLDPAQRISLIRDLQKDSTKRYERTAWTLGSLFRSKEKELLKQFSPWLNHSELKNISKNTSNMPSAGRKAILEKFLELSKHLSFQGISPSRTIKEGIPALSRSGFTHKDLEALFTVLATLGEHGFDPAYFMRHAIPEIYSRTRDYPDKLGEYLNSSLLIAREGIDPTDVFRYGFPEERGDTAREKTYFKSAVSLAKRGINPSLYLRYILPQLDNDAARAEPYSSLDQKTITKFAQEKIQDVKEIFALINKLAANREAMNKIQSTDTSQPATLSLSGEKAATLDQLYELEEKMSAARISLSKEREEIEKQLKTAIQKCDIPLLASVVDVTSHLPGPENTKMTIELISAIKQLQKIKPLITDIISETALRESSIPDPEYYENHPLPKSFIDKVFAIADLSTFKKMMITDLQIIELYRKIKEKEMKDAENLRHEGLENDRKALEKILPEAIERINGGQVKDHEQAKAKLTHFLTSIAMARLENSVYLRQAATTALKTIPGTEAEEAVMQILQDPDMMQKEVRLNENATQRSAADKIIESITWSIGEEELLKNYPEIRENIAFMFSVNPEFLEFLKEHPLRLFSVRDKKKIDSVTLGDFRKYWFKILGIIHFSSSTHDEEYKEITRKIELRHQNSPIDMGIAIETFKNKYLLSSVVFHEYLHYKGILSEGETRFRQVLFMKKLLAEDILKMTPKERILAETQLASLMNKLGISELAIDLEHRTTRENLPPYLENLNILIEKTYGPDGMTEKQIEVEKASILDGIERWISLRNQQLKEEQKIFPSRKLYEPVDEATRDKITELISRTRRINNKLAPEKAREILRDFDVSTETWNKYLEEGGFQTFSSEIKKNSAMNFQALRQDLLKLVVDGRLGSEDFLKAMLHDVGAGAKRSLEKDDFHGGSGIGKFESILIEDVLKKDDGKVEITAFIQKIGADEGERITITGEMSPFGMLPEVTRTDMPEIDTIMDGIVSNIRASEDRYVVILDPNEHKIIGIATTHKGSPFIAMERSVFGNPIADFHEVAHMSNEWGIYSSDTVLMFISDPEIRKKYYTDKLKAYGYTQDTAPESIKFHYALRALQRERFGEQDRMLTDAIKKSSQPSLEKAFGLLDKKARSSAFMAAVSRLAGVYTRVDGRSKLHFCVPLDVLKNSADISLALRRIAEARGTMPFTLVVTGVEGIDLGAINALGDPDIRKRMGIEGDFKIHAITEDEIIERANLLDKDASDPYSRACVVKDLYLEIIGEMYLGPGEYMAITTDHVSEQEARQLEKDLRKETGDNISIRIPVSPISETGMFSLSDLIHSWINNITRGEASTISLVLPRVISPVEMARMLGESMRNAWRLLIAA